MQNEPRPVKAATGTTNEFSRFESSHKQGCSKLARNRGGLNDSRCHWSMDYLGNLLAERGWTLEYLRKELNQQRCGICQ